MQHLKNLTRYVPDNEDKLKQAEAFAELAPPGASPLFLRDEKGQDWYDAQAGFAPTTVKIAYDGTGIVIDFAKDVSALVPLSLSVIELKVSSVPQGLDRSGNWIIQAGKVKARPVDYVAQATAQKKALLETARDNIGILQFADAQGIASDQEKALLNEWELFRLFVSRIDIASASGDVDWPEPPENVA